MNIVFMGTPEFAVPCLQRLIDEKHNVLGVFTQPDKPKGRGHKIQFPPVKELAVKYDIPVFQPQKMKDGEALKILKELNPELIIVVAYGKILPKEILELPKYGCVNMHASVLPKYRGSAPIQWCVLNGEKISGVTSMQMDVGLDTGDMLLCKTCEIGDDDTAGDLHDKLSLIGADVMSETISMIENNSLSPKKQDDTKSTYAPMLTKELCPVDWSKSAKEIHNQVRGLSPWPVATSVLNGKKFKIYKTTISGKSNKKPGEIVNTDNTISVCCGDGNCINIDILQTEGKKAMSSADFLRGNHIEIGELFN